jgi:methylated-DNA-protein-cysteine methyltransferase-like protein
LRKFKTKIKPKGCFMTQKNSFYLRVFDVVRLIPHGRVTSYGAIAAYLGARSSSRLVGWAMNASHGELPPVPAHRVVNWNGDLSGKAHFSSPERMKELLEKEGIQVVNDRVINFDEVFWDPVSLGY